MADQERRYSRNKKKHKHKDKKSHKHLKIEKNRELILDPECRSLNDTEIIFRNDSESRKSSLANSEGNQQHKSSSGHNSDRHDYKSRDNYSYSKTQRRDEQATSSSTHTGKGGKESSRLKSHAKDQLHDYDFDFISHKHALNKIFFQEDDIIKRNTDQYDDFWSFLKRYQSFRKRKAAEGKTDIVEKHSGETSAIGVPLQYDKRYRVNLAISPRDLSTYTEHDHKGQYSRHLSKERIQQFKDILLYYIDFIQKQKFTKLKKLKKDQESLPIYQYKEQIVEAVNTYPVIVVAGDTGCGKSTQVPQYLLKAGFEMIACTQPRRIACVSLAKRVAYETLNEFGSQVAFQVRFDKSKTSATKILFLTEGLLLRQISDEDILSKYKVIIVDEVHERHIHTDFLLGVLKCVMKQRSDVKVVLMSATINIHLFSNYFDNAPVLQVPGRLYPIELQYRPISAEEKSSRKERLDPSPYIRILQLIDKKYDSSERGDVLMFLSGLTEIMAVVEAAKMYSQQNKRWIVLPLHSALSVDEQQKVFDIAPEGIRKCIVSTNIAETSVTIDGVRFVVDSGKVKEMSHDPKCKMRRLQEFWISRASAEQRKGRAGRTGPGTCFRLFEESDYNNLQKYSTPEIQRVPLDSLILQLIVMGLSDARRFPFIEPPSLQSIETSIDFLQEQDALTMDEKLTTVGEALAQLPVDVMIGKMLIMGAIFQMTEAVLSIAAALSVQSPFTAQAYNNYEQQSARKDIESNHGDPFTLLNAFDEWVQVKTTNQNSRKWCKRRGLEEQRFYEMNKLKRQFKDLLEDHGILEKIADSFENLTSTERRELHAHKRRLREMKREERKKGVKRKVLKIEDEFEFDFDNVLEGHDEKPDLNADIKDLEFRLTNDLNQMQEISHHSRNFSRRDINLLKLIMCSGLYPNVAIADEHNSFKPESEQAFHTKNKPFVLLHPTCYFVSDLEPLTRQDKDIVDTGFASSSRKTFSSEHQLLAFVSLLETTKPYLVGVMRVPALQILTLFAKSIDTNSDCTRLVFDGWLEAEVLQVEDAEKLMSSVIKLRSSWRNLVQSKLKASGATADVDDSQVSIYKQERLLAKKLTEFLELKVVYSIRRILAAELSHIYVGQIQADEADASEQILRDIMKDATPHPTKGGYRVNTYLTVNCLIDDARSSSGGFNTVLQQHWTCPRCSQRMLVSIVDRLQHEQSCTSVNLDEATMDETGEDSMKQDTNFYCEKCDSHFNFKPTEILKHKRSCKV